MDAYYGQKEEFWKERRIKDLEKQVAELTQELDELRIKLKETDTRVDL